MLWSQPDNITRFGRRLGLVQDAIIMLLGLLMLTASWGANLNGWVICYAWSLFVYGIGVGGEYPMTATAAMENFMASGRISTKEDRLHRGRSHDDEAVCDCEIRFRRYAEQGYQRGSY